MELLIFVMLLIVLGLLAMRWGKDSTQGMPDGYRRQALRPDQ